MPKPAPFQKVLDNLRDGKTKLTARDLTSFSDLDPNQIKLLKQTWPEVPVERKRDLLRQIVEKYQEDFLVSYDNFAAAVLHDADAQVRTHATRLLLESQEPRLVPTFIDMLKNDPDQAVRAEVINTLGVYVYFGELDELRADLLNEIVDELLVIALDDAHPLLMRKAMEALGFSSRPEVNALIEAGFKHHDPQWVASALIAMGRSGLMRWEDNVLASLNHDNNQVRLAALDAAGEFGSDDARPILLRQLDEGETDEEVLRAIIWTLSRIGGEDVRTYLENLLDSEDDEQVEFVEEALENLDFTEEMKKFEMLALDPEFDEDLLEIDLFDDDDEPYLLKEEKPKEMEQKPPRKRKKTSGR